MKRVLSWLPVLTVAFLVGCGGGGSDDFLTRETEASMDRDALALASRESTGTRVSLSLAQQIDQDLRAARASFSTLNTVHVRMENNPRVIRMVVAKSASWLAAWESGEWRTGVSAIDEILRPLKVASVRKVSEGDSTAVFELTFSQWVRTKAVAFTLYDKSPAIQSVSLMPATDNPSDETTDELSYDAGNGIPIFRGAGLSVQKIGGVWQAGPSEAVH